MLLEVSSLPYSFYRLWIESSLIVQERFSFRPDLQVGANYDTSLKTEVFCNEASNISPISDVPGTEYLLPTHQFLKCFLEV
jgi:hypothetical protein